MSKQRKTVASTYLYDPLDRLAQYVEQVTAVAQQNGARLGDVFEVYAVGSAQVQTVEAFEQLGHGQNARRRIGMQHVRRALAVNQQAGDQAVYSGQRDVLVHKVHSGVLDKAATYSSPNE